MRRAVLFSVFFFFLFSFLAVSLTIAQEFDFNRAYEDYLHNFNQYQQAHQEYEAAKSAYLTYGTLTAKTEAQTKTLTMLQARDMVVKTYLTALRLRLADATGISNYEENVLYIKLDDEVNWYVDHQDSLSSAGTLDDLVKISQKAQDQYGKTESLAYQTLGSMVAGKEKDLRDQLKNQIEAIGNKLGEIRQNGDKDTKILERWLLEAENKLTLSQQKEFEALQTVARIGPGQTNKLNQYSRARITLQESNQYLKEANNYLKEIIREVKVAD